MILMKEKIQHHQSNRDNFLNRIKNNFDTFYDDKHDDLNEIIKYINSTDAFIKDLIDSKYLDQLVGNEIKLQNESIQKVITHYHIDEYFNKTRADKWLVNALVLVVRDSNTFDGVWFIGKEKKVLKLNILKK